MIALGAVRGDASQTPRLVRALLRPDRVERVGAYTVYVRDAHPPPRDVDIVLAEDADTVAFDIVERDACASTYSVPLLVVSRSRPLEFLHPFLACMVVHESEDHLFVLKSAE